MVACLVADLMAACLAAHSMVAGLTNSMASYARFVVVASCLAGGKSKTSAFSSDAGDSIVADSDLRFDRPVGKLTTGAWHRATMALKVS